jgi:hypothetical protein
MAVSKPYPQPPKWNQNLRFEVVTARLKAEVLRLCQTVWLAFVAYILWHRMSDEFL